jgi:chromosome segregation ATPase
MIADSADIKFACSQCGQRIVVDKSAAGLEGNCPICEGPVTVPHVSGPQDRSGVDGCVFGDPGEEEMREELFESASQLGQLQRELDKTHKELERQRALFKKAVDECERITASATHAQAEIKSFQADRQQLKADLASAKQRALSAETQVAELAAALAAANQEGRALQERVDHDLSLAQARLAATETQLNRRERELAAAREENAEIVQSLALAQSEVASAGLDLSRVMEELESTQRTLERSTEYEAELSKARDDLQRRLDEIAADKQRLAEEHHQLREHAEVLRKDLTETDSGKELFELRTQLRDVTADRGKIAETLAEKRTEVKTLTEIKDTLINELKEAHMLREEAERRAAANSESQLQKDNEILRGIVARQNATLSVQHGEVRKLRRGRFGLRIIYGVFALALLGLAAFAVAVFTNRDLQQFFNQLFH